MMDQMINQTEMLYSDSEVPGSTVPDVPLSTENYREWGYQKGDHVLWVQNKFNRKHPFLCSIWNGPALSVPDILSSGTASMVVSNKCHFLPTVFTPDYL